MTRHGRRSVAPKRDRYDPRHEQHRRRATTYPTPQAVEERWQDYWREHGTYEVDNDDPRPHYYTLYLLEHHHHRSHRPAQLRWLIRRVADGRRIEDNVVVALGFDSFGLPPTRRSRPVCIHSVFTDERIGELRSSIERIGAVYDWRREIKSHDPLYIRFTQWIFLRLFEAGLAYRKQAP